MLTLEHVQGFYGRTQALFDITLTVNSGQILALVGTNGAGKSSTLRAILGLIGTQGSVIIDGTDVSAWPAHRRVRDKNIGVVPESKSLFPRMSVRENMLVGASKGDSQRLDIALDAFPVLKDRLNEDVGSLSGGQRQMVALARTFMRAPKLLLLDEPGLGLAPVIVDEIYAHIRNIAADDMAVILVEQSTARVASTADYVQLISIGRSGPKVAATDSEMMARLEDEAMGSAVDRSPN